MHTHYNKQVKNARKYIPLDKIAYIASMSGGVRILMKAHGFHVNARAVKI